MSHIIRVNPQDITRYSVANGGGIDRDRRIKEHGFTENGFRLGGDWDTLPCILTGKNGIVDDLNKALAGRTDLKAPYDWMSLYNSIKENGFHYDFDRDVDCIRVAIGRSGDIQFVDGRHRLTVCRHLGLTDIPVKVIYIHQDWDFQRLDAILDDTMPSLIMDEIVAKWDKEVPYYQKLFEQDHFAFAFPDMQSLKGKKVLEVGCSSFLSSWALIKAGVHSVVGVERDLGFTNNGQVTVDCLNKGFGDKLKIRHNTLYNYLRTPQDDYNAFFSSMVLYWLSDQEVRLLRTQVLPKCEVAVCIVRDYERPNQRNCLKLNRIDNAVKLFADEGFAVNTNYFRLQDDGQGGYFVLNAQR